MDVSKIPILLTSSVVAHDPGVRLRDSSERLRLALESVDAWRKIAPHNPLVLCDGSGFDFTPEIKPWINRQVPIECISYTNDIEMMLTHGRGYGEGEIVRYATDHSYLIQKAGCFVKCTSKLWVENFSNCMKPWNGQLLLKGVFENAFTPINEIIFSYIDTRFYAINLDVYRKYFINAHTHIRLNQGHGLEECFSEIFVKSDIQNSIMFPPPIICGVGGGTGKYYKNSKIRKLKEYFRYQLIRNSPKFKAWFVR